MHLLAAPLRQFRPVDQLAFRGDDGRSIGLAGRDEVQCALTVVSLATSFWV